MRAFTPQVNEIQNLMPSWMPGEDHMINFRKGDPYTKVDEGYARSPGAGYAALHPELEGLDPEDYPDITKLSILGDVAPYSREYNRIRASVEKHSRGDAELRSRYEQIVDQVRQTKESTLSVDERRFDAPVDKLEGTVKIIYTWSLSSAYIGIPPRAPGERGSVAHPPKPRFTLLPTGPRFSSISELRIPHASISFTLAPIHMCCRQSRTRLRPTLNSCSWCECVPLLRLCPRAQTLGAALQPLSLFGCLS